jgi:hypothetical protein
VFRPRYGVKPMNSMARYDVAKPATRTATMARAKLG